MSSELFNKTATPFTAGLFLVSAVSGIALFFHFGGPYFHGMHEWLSMVLLLPFVLHVWKNWTPFVGYFRRGWLVLPLGLSVAAAVAFAVPALTGAERGGNPVRQAVRLITGAKLTDLAPLLKRSPDEVATQLRNAGYTVSSNGQTLAEIAAASGRDPRAILHAVMRTAKRR